MLYGLRKKRQVFYSFDYKPDVFRVQQVLKMGVVEEEQLLSPNQWEKVKKGGDYAIKKWIHDNMAYRSCVIVLVGSNTANKRWVQYEIEKGWNDGKGVVGIYIHNLKCLKSGYCNKGPNPFRQFILRGGKVRKDLYDPVTPISRLYNSTKNFADVVKCYEPPINSFLQLISPDITTGQLVYRSIKENINEWVEEAITIRNQNNNLFWPFG